MQDSARSVDEIIREARGKLRDRETRLQDLFGRVKGELDEVRKALRKLGTPSHNGSTAGVHAPKPSKADPELGDRIVETLKASLDPLTASQVAAAIDTSPQGAATKLRHMEREGLVERVEGGWGLPSSIGREDEEG